MKLLSFLTLLFLSINCQAQLTQRVPADRLLLGSSSTASKEFVFNVASFPAMSWDDTNYAFTFDQDDILFGDGVGDVNLRFNAGGAYSTHPKFSYDITNTAFRFSTKNVIVGNGTNTGRVGCLYVDTGVDPASFPATCYNADLSQFEVTLDGVSWASFPATGGGGGGGGDVLKQDTALHDDATKMAICAFRIDTSGSVLTDRGNCVASVANNAAGDANVTLETNFFSAAVECASMGRTATGDTTSQIVCTSQFDGLGATTLRVLRHDDGAKTDGQCSLICFSTAGSAIP